MESARPPVFHVRNLCKAYRTGEVDVLLCDEPTGALDSKTGVKVLEALTRVSEETGATTLVITHKAAIADIADRVVLLANGTTASGRRNATRLAASAVSW